MRLRGASRSTPRSVAVEVQRDDVVDQLSLSLSLARAEPSESPTRGWRRAATMHIPVVCFSCGRSVGHLWKPYHERLTNGESHAQICTSMEIRRMCCKRMIISHTDICDFVTMQKFADTQDTVTRFKCSVDTERVVACD